MCQLCGANWQRPAKRGAQFYAKDPTGTDSKKANKLWKSPGKKLIMEAWGACEHELEEVQLRLEAAFEKIDLEGMTPVNDRRARRIFLPVLATVQFPDGWLAYAPADKIKELRVATFKMFKSDMKNRKTKQLQKAAKSEPKTSPSVPRMDAPPTPLSSSVPQRSAKPSQRPASFEKLPFGESLIYANRSGPAEPYVYVYDLCEPSKNAKDLTPRDLEWEKFNVSLVENDDQDSVVSYFVDGVGYKRITNVKGLQLALGHIYSTNGGFLELRIARKTDPATSSKRSPTAEDSARPSKVRRLNEDMRGLSVSALPSEERDAPVLTTESHEDEDGSDRHQPHEVNYSNGDESETLSSDHDQDAEAKADQDQPDEFESDRDLFEEARSYRWVRSSRRRGPILQREIRQVRGRRL